MSSGVRNLRAMFENGNAASPEPRGRSPGDTPAPEEESRPTPKVRASFVAVGPTASIPPPDLGTTKGTPTNSVTAHRRESFHVSQDNAEGIAELRKEVSAEKEERKKSVAVAEAVPEEAVASRESSIPAPPMRSEPAGEMATNLGEIMKGSEFPESSVPQPEKVETAPVKEAPAQPPQTPVKEKKKPAKLSRAETPGKAKTETPAKAKPETPKPKTQEKAAVDPFTDAPAPQAPAKTEEKPEEKLEEKPTATLKDDTPAVTEVPAEKEETPAPVQPETPVKPQEEKPTTASSDDAPAEPTTPTKVEEEDPVSASGDVPVAADTPEQDEQEAVEASVKDTAPDAAVEAQEDPDSTPPNDEPAPSSNPTETEDEPAELIESLADNPDKDVTGAQEEVSLKPADPTDEATVAGGKGLPPPTEPLQAASTPQPTAATAKPAESKAKPNGTPGAKAKPELKKPTAISTAKASTSKVAAVKSPLLKTAPRTPTTSKTTSAAPAAKPSPVAAKPKPTVAKPTALKAESKPPAAKEPAKEPAKAAPPRTNRLSLRPGASSTATAPTASAASKTKIAAPESKKPAVTKPAASSTAATTTTGGFKKPAPKSPTRPVKLPAHLIAPTAASAAKHGEEQKITRKPSTTTRPKAAAPGTKPARASLAPAATAPKRPDSRASTTGGAPKGDFLSRMMRPTTASASKTHDKPASPPRKGTKAPVSALQKGKKKVEEVAAMAKDAVTSNGHAEDSKSNGTPAEEEATEAHDDEHAQPGASEGTSDAAAPVEGADASVAGAHAPQTAGETTVH